MKKKLYSIFVVFIVRKCVKAKTPTNLANTKIRESLILGRSDETRTRGLMDPNHARYQTALHPDVFACHTGGFRVNVCYYSADGEFCQAFLKIFFSRFVCDKMM